MKNPKSLDERIGEALQQSLESGELHRARGWGKRLDFGDGYDETPPDLRMGYKILKDAGAAPLEVELMREVRALEEQLGKLDAGSPEAGELRAKITDLRLEVALRIEAMGRRPRA